MFGLFKKKSSNKIVSKPLVDIHSHLLPGLDDGVQTLEESLDILLKFEQEGYQKVVTTPHIMGDFYKNTPSGIRNSLNELREFIKGKTTIKIDAAAEYYLDESFVQLLDGNEEVLTLGNKYLLFETSFMAEPIYLKEAIFKMQSLGYKPVLAHPERYIYLQENSELMTDLFDRGIFFQLNINSLIGYYSKPVQKMAQKMINNNMFHFLGSDCHNMSHLEATFEAISSKAFQNAMEQNVLNDTLLEL